MRLEKETLLLLFYSIIIGLFNRYAMAQTSTLSKFLFRKNTAKLFLLLLFTCLAGYTQAQTVPIFTETLDISRGRVNITVDKYQEEGTFDNDHLNFSGTATIAAAVPSNYLNASGGNYIVATKGQYVQIDGINTLNYTGLQLSFGVSRNSNNQQLTVEYSDNKGVSWKQISIGSFGNNNVWQYKTGITETTPPGGIPQVASLSLRFRNSSGGNGGGAGDDGNIRLDDIRLSGISSSLAPVIKDFTPKVGGEGTVVTITGENLLNTEYVSFITGGARGQNVVATETSITFTVPADGETSRLRVVTFDGKLAETAVVFNYLRAEITDMTPRSGPIGTRVTITGERLASATYAIFTGPVVDGKTTEVKADIISTRVIGKTSGGIDIAEVVVDVPRGAVKGRVDLWTEDYGFGRGFVFDVNKPAIFEVAPDKGRVGDEVTIIGDRLNIRVNGNPLIVTFSGIDGPVSAVVRTSSYGELTVRVPDGAITGPITVTTGEGTAVSPIFTVMTAIIVLEGTVNPFVTNYGVPSASQQYSMTGRFLIDGFIDVVAPLHFEVSTDGITWGRSIRYEGMQDATIGPVPVHVRYNPTGEATSHSGNVSHSSTGVVKLLAVTGSISNIPLPVELISFNARKQNDAVLLTWATASEQDNDFFDVEMAEDPKAEFKAVGKVYSKVNTTSIKQNYQFSHKGNFVGTRYYRLKQVDLDGTFEYSKVVAVESRGVGLAPEVKVYPNPITPESKLLFPSTEAGKLHVTVMNMNGSRIDSKSYDIEAGDNRIDLNLSNSLPAGIYILTTEFNGQTQQVKLMKQ